MKLGHNLGDKQVCCPRNFLNFSCLGLGDQAKDESDSDVIMQLSRYDDHKRCYMFGSCAYVFIRVTEEFSFSCDEGAKGQKC